MGTTAAHRPSHGEILGSDSPRGNKGKRQRATGNAEASPTKPGIPSQESQASEPKPPYTHTSPGHSKSGCAYINTRAAVDRCPFAPK